MAAVLPLLLAAVGSAGPVAGRAAWPPGDAMRDAIRWNGGGEVRARQRAPRPRRQGHRAAGLRAAGAVDETSRRPTSRSAWTSRPWSPSGPVGRARFPALKIKCGGPADLATLRAVREVYAGPLRVDANTGWTPEVAVALLPELVALGVELIEQPFPAGRLDWLADLQERSTLPLVADESCVTDEDLDGLVGVVAGVNVKLAKCGGPGPAARMLARARELGFRTFLGCMEETSVVIAASAAVASLADWVDLDGNLLLAADPFEGLELGPDHAWRLSDRPGPRGHAALVLSRRLGPVPARRGGAANGVWISSWTKRWRTPLPAGSAPDVP